MTLRLNGSTSGYTKIDAPAVAGNSFIPPDPAITDYQAYLRWLEEGNTPLPAEQASPAEQPDT